MLERIPDELLARVPDGEETSVLWQLVHIADGPDWWMTHVLKDGGEWSWPPRYAGSRSGVAEGLAASRDRVLRFFRARAGAPMAMRYSGTDPGEEWTGRDRVLYLTEHEVHHRGRIVLALRQWGFDAFPGDPGDNLWPAAEDAPDAHGEPVAAGRAPRAATWELVRELMVSLIDRLERIDDLAPAFPDELYEARDASMEGLQVGDYLERLGRHSRDHREHLSAIRAAIGRSRPTGPTEDADPVSGEPYSAIWYQWLLLEALMRRADLVGQLIGLNDGDLDRRPDPRHTAGSAMTVSEVCRHVLEAEDWQMRGIEDGLSHWRQSHAAAPKAEA